MNIRFGLLVIGMAIAAQPVSGRSIVPFIKQREPKQVFSAPILGCGTQADVLVTDGSGEPLEGINVKINDEVVKTDSSGHASFSVPEAENLAIVVERGNGLKEKYVRTGDLLVTQVLPANIAEALCADYTAKNVKLPRLLFAPGTIQPGKDFIVTGVRFPGSSADSRIYVDGREAEVLAASTVSIMARAPEKLHTGAIREIYVSCNGLNTNTAETDICKVDFSWPESPDPDGAPQDVRLAALGTYMPIVVEVLNRSDDVSLWLPDQKPMGKRGVFLTPGGERNALSLQIRRTTAATPKIETNLVPEIPTGVVGERSGIISMVTRHDLCKAQIIRLQRRLISVQARIEETRKNIEADDKQSDTSLAEMRELSLRQNRIQNMLESRRALLMALGGSEAEYRQVIDDASGKTIANLELKIQMPKFTGESTGSTFSPTSEPPQTAAKRRGRLHRFVEPVIRLLPPMPEDEQSKSQASAPVPSSASTGSNTTAELKPAIPEPPTDAAIKRTVKTETVTTTTTTTVTTSSKKELPVTKSATKKAEACRNVDADKSARAKAGQRKVKAEPDPRAQTTVRSSRRRRAQPEITPTVNRTHHSRTRRRHR